MSWDKIQEFVNDFASWHDIVSFIKQAIVTISFSVIGLKQSKKITSMTNIPKRQLNNFYNFYFLPTIAAAFFKKILMAKYFDNKKNSSIKLKVSI
ncbi:MAG: hypothetical protein Q7V63_06290 [Gammaproteobacteria bacterium]|nr:hypothetical protein [Gammaproteobacteria bacterium]